MAAPVIQRLACPIYEGKHYDPSAARAFLAEYNVYCNAYNLNDASKFETLQTALKGEARFWLLSHMDMTPDANWTTALAAFRQHFTAPVPRASRAAMAAECRQRANEGVRQFLTRCSRVAFETTSTPAELPTRQRQVPVDGGGVIDVDVQPDDADIAAARRFWAIDKAMDLFVAGCNNKIREPLVLDKTWATWQEMSDRAILIEQSVHPQQLDRQVRNFGPGPVHAVDDARPQQQQQQPGPPPPPAAPPAAPVAPVGGARARPKRQYKGRPDPQQQPTHAKPIICDYCGGKFHIASGCLAKKKAAPAANIYAVQGPPQAPQWQQQQPPQQPVQWIQVPQQLPPQHFQQPPLQQPLQQPMPEQQAAQLLPVAAWDPAQQFYQPGFPHGE